MVCHQGSFSSRWSLIRVVFNQGSLSLGLFLIRVVFHQGGLSLGWSVIRVVFNQGGLSLGWSVIKVVSLQGGLGLSLLLFIYLLLLISESQGLRSPCDYLATQAPLISTVPDFWKMVWEQKSPIVVMLCGQPMERGQVIRLCFALCNTRNHFPV